MDSKTRQMSERSTLPMPLPAPARTAAPLLVVVPMEGQGGCVVSGAVRPDEGGVGAGCKQAHTPRDRKGHKEHVRHIHTQTYTRTHLFTAYYKNPNNNSNTHTHQTVWSG